MTDDRGDGTLSPVEQGPPDAAAATQGPGPAVSVCIPLYRKEAYIGETIRSVLDQTFTDFELVVLDNASPDRSAARAHSFDDDPRVRVLKNARTVPPATNFAAVVAASSAPLVKVVCADDLLRPTILERQVAILRDDPDLAMVTCRHDLIDGLGSVVARDRTLRTPDLVGRQDRATVLRRLVRHGGNPLGSLNNVTFRRAAFDAAGGFPDDLDFFVLDVAMWVRLLEHGDYFGMPETLAAFRINSGSHSHDMGGRAIAVQRDFVSSLRYANPHAVRPADRVVGALRAPLTRLRHRLLFAAAGPAGPLSGMASTVLRLGGGTPR